MNWESGADSRELSQTNFCKEIHLDEISSGQAIRAESLFRVFFQITNLNKQRPLRS